MKHTCSARISQLVMVSKRLRAGLPRQESSRVSVCPEEVPVTGLGAGLATEFRFIYIIRKKKHESFKKSDGNIRYLDIAAIMLGEMEGLSR